MTKTWYDELYDENFNNNTKGYFSQVVWKATTTVGFGIAQSESGVWYGVGNYYPPGNEGDYIENVPGLL